MGEMLPSPLKTVTRPPDTAPRRKGMPRVLSRVEEGVRRAPKPAKPGVGGAAHAE